MRPPSHWPPAPPGSSAQTISLQLSTSQNHVGGPEETLLSTTQPESSSGGGTTEEQEAGSSVHSGTAVIVGSHRVRWPTKSGRSSR